MSQKLYLSEQAKKEVEQSIETLENATSGELVVYVAKQSDNYSDAIWYLSALNSLFIATSLGVLSYFWLLPNDFGVLHASIFVLAAGIAGILIPLIFTRARVILMKDDSVNQRVSTRAHDIFVTNELFNTKERIGILFYVSGLERKIKVLADSGINSRVNQENLDSLVSDITGGIKNNQFKEGLIKAISDCQKLLLEDGFNHKSNDTNEIKNQVISEFNK